MTRRFRIHDAVRPSHRKAAMGLAMTGVIAVTGALGCGDATPLITSCTAASNIEPICTFQNPEDLAVLPDGRTLVVSQFGSMDGAKSGNLAVFDTLRRSLRVVYPSDDAPAAKQLREDGWGDVACPGPPDESLAPHGFDLSTRTDGRLQLLVVNHGGREAIEFFEVTPAGIDTRIAWRGCAVSPDDSYLNDVVAAPEGGLLTTHMMPKSGETMAILRASLLGSDTGHVLEWSPEAGWSKVAGTDAPFPNGIEIAHDGASIYVNVYLASEVRRIDRKTGELLAYVEVAQPDNITWSSDGQVLLVASHTGGMRENMTCMDIDEGSCGMPFEIVAIDPNSLARKTLVAHAGPPMGGATVAVQVGTDLWLGTFAGDRVARVVGAATSMQP